MSKPFDYSKWDKIELSDDDADVHPNIDKDSWFRMKHRTRLEREAKEDEEIKRIEALNADDQSRLNIITARLKKHEKGVNTTTSTIPSSSTATTSTTRAVDDDDGEFEDTEALHDEATELKENIAMRNKRVRDINERRNWNIDNICKIKDEKTVVNSAQIASLKAEDFQPTGETEAVFASKKAESDTKVAAASTSTNDTTPAKGNDTTTTTTAATAKPSSTSTSPSTTTTTNKPTAVTKPAATAPTAQSESKKRENFSVMSYNDYVLKHELLLEEFSTIVDMEATKKFLFNNCDILLHEHAQAYMLLSCLEDEMNGKHERMKKVCRQSQILSHLSELGSQMHRDPRDVILPFFMRMEEDQYLNGFKQAVNEFRQRIVERAKVKRREMDDEARKKAMEDGDVPLGPGGLNPIEVLER